MNNWVIKVDAFKLLAVENLKYSESKSSETFSSNYLYKLFQGELLAKNIPASSSQGKEKRCFFIACGTQEAKNK